MKKLFVFLALLLALGMTCVLAEDTTHEFEYYFQGDGRIILWDYDGSAQHLVIPETLDGHPVAGLSYGLFYGNDTLQSVTIPDSVDISEGNPFEYCPALTDIIVSPSHPTLTAIEGVLYNKEVTKVISYPTTKSEATYTVPHGVTTIGIGAVASNHYLTKVILPDSLVLIDDYAFSSCSSLTDITLPESVTTLGYYAFAYNDALTSIALPNSVVTLEGNPFVNCSALTSIRVSLEHPTFAVTDGLLYEKDEKQLICYPFGLQSDSITIPQGIRIIGEDALSGFSMSSVILPDTVTTIGNSAFIWCDNMKTINIPPAVTLIDDYAFYGCESLPSITIPDSVTAIGYCAFAYCKALTEVVIPKSVTMIDSRAFAECENLTSIVVPASVTEIEEDVFSECPLLTLTVTPGSHAEQYAKDNNIPCTYADDVWACTCGAINTTNFCPDCGTARPVDPTCANCGYDPEGDTPNYCPDCGTKF